LALWRALACLLRRALALACLRSGRGGPAAFLARGLALG